MVGVDDAISTSENRRHSALGTKWRRWLRLLEDVLSGLEQLPGRVLGQPAVDDFAVHAVHRHATGQLAALVHGDGELGVAVLGTECPGTGHGLDAEFGDGERCLGIVNELGHDGLLGWGYVMLSRHWKTDVVTHVTAHERCREGLLATKSRKGKKEGIYIKVNK